MGFSNKEDEATHHGICVVNIPCGLKTGATKPGFFQSWRKGTAGIVVKTISGMPEPDFWSGLEKSLEPSVDENSFLLFLHGYKVTFENAAIRTAQLKYDLHIPHAAFYSWPSKAWYIGYDADIRSVEASVPRMAAFISQLAKLTAGRQIKLHVVAHSMGNLGLLLALERVLLDLKGVAPQFGLADVVFAAPDVDRVKFIDYVPRTTAMFQQQTLYASRKDKALWLSGWPRLATRAGKIPPVTIAKQTDTIDVAELDLSWLGHGYVAELRPVLTDMFNSMHYGAPPGKRPGLGDAQSPAGNYWTLI